MENTIAQITNEEIITLLNKFEIVTQMDQDSDIEYLREGLNTVVKIILESNLKIGLNSQWYKYYPQNQELTQWIANDGTVIDKSIVAMIRDYYEDDNFVRNLMEYEDYNFGDLEYFLCKKR